MSSHASTPGLAERRAVLRGRLADEVHAVDLRLDRVVLRADRRELADHGDALLDRLADRRHDGVAVVGLDDERLELARGDRVLDLRDLLGRSRSSGRTARPRRPPSAPAPGRRPTSPARTSSPWRSRRRRSSSTSCRRVRLRRPRRASLSSSSPQAASASDAATAQAAARRRATPRGCGSREWSPSALPLLCPLRRSRRPTTPAAGSTGRRGRRAPPARRPRGGCHPSPTGRYPARS